MKSYKNIFKFKAGTTSYILHSKKNNLIRNVEYLKDKFDVIQLLFFGKNYIDECLKKELVSELNKFREESNVEYALHLPVDFYLLEDDKKSFNFALEVLKKIFDKTDKLKIRQYILHIDRYDRSIDFDKKSMDKYEKVLEKVSALYNPEKIFIENTSHDISMFAAPILKNNFSICLDIPHAFIYKYDYKNITSAFKNKIKLLHIYGFKSEDKHKGLNYASRERQADILNFLRSYKKEVIVEVFGRGDLIRSMKILEKNPELRK